MIVSNTQERLKEVMRKQNLRQIDIVEKCQPFCKKYGVKISKSDISQYINYGNEPKQDKLFILSLALGVTPQYLMGYDEPIKSDEEIRASVIAAIAKNDKAFEVAKMFIELPEPLQETVYNLIKSMQNNR